MVLADQAVEVPFAAPRWKRQFLSHWAQQAASLLLIFSFLQGLAHAAPQFPALTGRVVDEAGVLSAATRAQLTQLSEQFERSTSNQLVVVTLKTLQGYPIEDYGYQLGRFWGIGQKDKNNGVLLIVVPIEREVRIEVGYGLEGALTDALASNIIQTLIIPEFRRGDLSAGMVAGAQAIAAVFAGEYQPSDVAQSPATAAPDMPLPALLILGVVIGQVLAAVFSRVLAGTVVGVIAAVVMWVTTGTLFMALVAGVMIFLFVALVGRGGRHGGPWMGGSGGGLGGGGFSGGGGSFGGGGASGRW